VVSTETTFFLQCV